MVNNDIKERLLNNLENFEVQTYDTEKDAIPEVERCVPSQLFSLVSRASFYRAVAGLAEELFPEDENIKEHVKSSHNLLLERALPLTKKFENECKCKK